MRRELALLRARQTVRVILDFARFGPTASGRLCCTMILAALLFGVSLGVSLAIGDGSLYAVVQAGTIFATVFVGLALLILGPDDAAVAKRLNYLATYLPEVEAAWQERKARLAEERRRREQERIEAEEQEREEEEERREQEEQRTRDAVGRPKGMDTAYCPRCQLKHNYRLSSTGTIHRCQRCGRRYELVPDVPISPGPGRAQVVTKSAALAAMLEIIPGLFFQTFGIGNIYAGNVGSGQLFMFGYWFLLAVNVGLLFCCGVGVVTGSFCWLMTMIVSTVSAINAASAGHVVIR
jgi:hypothetical protein